VYADRQHARRVSPPGRVGHLLRHHPAGIDEVRVWLPHGGHSPASACSIGSAGFALLSSGRRPPACSASLREAACLLCFPPGGGLPALLPSGRRPLALLPSGKRQPALTAAMSDRPIASCLRSCRPMGPRGPTGGGCGTTSGAAASGG